MGVARKPRYTTTKKRDIRGENPPRCHPFILFIRPHVRWVEEATRRERDDVDGRWTAVVRAFATQTDEEVPGKPKGDVVRRRMRAKRRREVIYGQRPACWGAFAGGGRSERCQRETGLLDDVATTCFVAWSHSRPFWE